MATNTIARHLHLLPVHTHSGGASGQLFLTVDEPAEHFHFKMLLTLGDLYRFPLKTTVFCCFLTMWALSLNLAHVSRYCEHEIWQNLDLGWERNLFDTQTFPRNCERLAKLKNAFWSQEPETKFSSVTDPTPVTSLSLLGRGGASSTERLWLVDSYRFSPLWGCCGCRCVSSVLRPFYSCYCHLLDWECNVVTVITFPSAWFQINS